MIVRIAALLTTFQLILASGNISVNFRKDNISAVRLGVDQTLNFMRGTLQSIQQTNQLIIGKIDDLYQLVQLQQAECKKNFEDLKKECISTSSNSSQSSNGNCIDLPKQSQTLPENCANINKSGIYNIQVPNSDLKPFFVYCQRYGEKQKELSWMIIQRRTDGSINFERNWSDYQRGFGNLDGEFFIGLDKLHELTQTTLHELWIQIEAFDSSKRFAKYRAFAIGSEADDYAIRVLGDYSGDAGDSLMKHVDRKFSTTNMDNDNINYRNCSVVLAGGWWYNNCYKNLSAFSNLNGKYIRGVDEKKNGQGVVWSSWLGAFYSLRYTHLAIRPISWPNKEHN